MTLVADTPPQAWIDRVEFRWPSRLQLHVRWQPGLPAGTPVALARLDLASDVTDTLELVVERPSGDESATEGWSTVSWPAMTPRLRRVELRAATGCDTDIDAQVAARLYRLLAETDADYDALYLAKDQRWGDSGTQFFLAEQVCQGFQGTPAYRCSAAVICGYKAAELAEPALVARARHHLDDGQTWAGSLPPHGHPRRNPEHLRQSMLAARWHLDMAADDPQACLQTLCRARELTADLRSYFTPAFPGARSMVLLGWMHHKAGRAPEAEAAWRLAIDLFRWAVRDSKEDSSVLFAELRDIQDSAIVAARALALVQGQKIDKPIDSRVVLQKALRVSGPAGQRLMVNACRWWGETLEVEGG